MKCRSYVIGPKKERGKTRFQRTYRPSRCSGTCTCAWVGDLRGGVFFIINLQPKTTYVCLDRIQEGQYRFDFKLSKAHTVFLECRVKLYPNPPYSLIHFYLLSEHVLKQKCKLKYA